MTIEQAIEKAIEGGYKCKISHNVFGADTQCLFSMYIDPLFWQSLGKAMGWGMVNDFSGEMCVRQHGNCTDMDCNPEWKYQWHRFIDHLIEGKDTESFFTNL